jgi:polar amino acid transport system substrate-binding protein
MRLFYLLLAWLAMGSARADTLVLMTEEYPPFNMSDSKGKLVGISTDIVRALMQDAHIAYTVTVSPWMRAMTSARTQLDHCVYSTSRLPEREKDYSWIGPLAYNDWYLFAKANPQRRPGSLEDARGARIGSYFGDGGVAYLQKRGFTVDVAPSDDVNPRKLDMGRIDYWASGKLSGQYLLKAQGIEGIEPVLKLERGDMYLACHPDMPKVQVARLNLLLQGLHKRGVVARIYARYGYTP